MIRNQELQAHADMEAVLSISGVHVQYGDKRVLQDINLSVSAGEFVGLIGQNGAGKRRRSASYWDYWLPPRGTSILQASQSGVVSLVGYVPQKIHLDTDTPMRARDLVGLGIDGHRFGIPLPRQDKRKRVNEMLKAVEADAFADAPVGRLSGGEQQRLLIAMALLARPRVLLLDEPLSNLDIRSAHEVVSLVSRLAKEQEIAVVLVAHDMNPLLGVMDKIVYLAGGRAAMGSVDQVVQSDVLTRLYGYDVEAVRVRNRILVVGGQDSDLTGPFGAEGHYGKGGWEG